MENDTTTPTSQDGALECVEIRFDLTVFSVLKALCNNLVESIGTLAEFLARTHLLWTLLVDSSALAATESFSSRSASLDKAYLSVFDVKSETVESG